MIDEEVVAQQESQNEGQSSTLPLDYFHDVGLYKGRDFSETAGHVREIIQTGKIKGGTEKGGQVSQNHGPTNWNSALSLRIHGDIPNIGPDEYAPPYANWYGTGSRSIPIEISGNAVEVVVNGDSPQEISQRMAIVQEGLGDMEVKVTSIEDLLSERFDNITQHFESEESRQEFLDTVASMDITQQKELARVLTEKVGGLLAEHYPHLSSRERSMYLDFESAKAIESLAPQAIADTYENLAFESVEEADEFYGELSQLSYPRQLEVGLNLVKNPNSVYSAFDTDSQ